MDLTIVAFICIIATVSEIYISVHRGLVKWYDRGLQNLWWEFDSLIPCSQKVLESLVFTGFRALSFFCHSKACLKKALEQLPQRSDNNPEHTVI